MKSGVDLDALRVQITEMCRTKSGALTLVVGKGEVGARVAKKLRVAVAAVLGADAGVQINSNTLLLHVQGISGENVPTEIKTE